MRILLVVTTVVAITVLASAQQSLESLQKETESKLLDAPFATYKLTAKARAVQVCNHSPVAIRGFRLGCVEQKGEDWLILNERDSEEHELPASGETVTCWSVAANHGLFPLEECSQGKLAVTEVELADGKKWKLKQ